MDAPVSTTVVTAACAIAHHADSVLLVKNHRQIPPVWEFPKQNRPALKAGFRNIARKRLNHVAKLELENDRFVEIRHKLVVGNRLITVFAVELADSEVDSLPQYMNGAALEVKMLQRRELGRLTDLSPNDRELILALA